MIFCLEPWTAALRIYIQYPKNSFFFAEQQQCRTVNGKFL